MSMARCHVAEDTDLVHGRAESPFSQGVSQSWIVNGCTMPFFADFCCKLRKLPRS